MKKIRLTLEIKVNEEKLKEAEINDQLLLDNIVVQDHDVLDGLELYRFDIGNFDSCSNFFLSFDNNVIVDKKIIES